jgi:ribosome maturation factor RimP
MHSPLSPDLTTQLDKTLLDLGYELVRIMLFPGRRAATLQIMAERADRAAMTVDDCETITRAISPVLDVADPIKGHYSLEVSSPGIDRPLTRLHDFARFAGFVARVELHLPLPSGAKRLKGHAVGVNGESVRFLPESGEELLLPFTNIRQAKLLLTDELIAATAAQDPIDAPQ